MTMEYLGDPDEGCEPDEADVHRWEEAQCIIKRLGIRGSEPSLQAIRHGLMNIQETYEEMRFYYVDERFALAGKQIKEVAKAAKKLRILLAQLGEGARFALNSNRKSEEMKQAWKKAGGENLPKMIGPASDESRFDINKDNKYMWENAETRPRYGVFGPMGYIPSPIEIQLKYLEEWIELRSKALREFGKSRKPKRMGDVLSGGHPRRKMVELCTILLGTHEQDLSANLLPLIQMIEKSVVGSDDEEEWKGTEAAMKARWWWEEVGPYYGKPDEQVPADKRVLIKMSWTAMPRNKPKKPVTSIATSY